MPTVPLFWLVALVLVGTAVAALVWPLLRARGPRTVEPDDVVATDVYRDQKRQLDAELTAGAITRDERDASLEELALRLGAEIDAQPPAARPLSSTRTSYITAVVLAAVLPVTALVLYAALGNPGAMRAAIAAREHPPVSQDEIVAMVEKLATRMKQHPEDPTGWRLLARAYSAMGRYPEAVAAFNEAATRGPEDASLLADWADALAMQNRSLQGEPTRLIARALTVEPNHPKALSLAASAALDRKDFDRAIADWRKLRSQFPAASREATEVDAMIAEAEVAKRGVPATDRGNSNADDASAIAGNVSLDPRLRDQASAGDTLFIFARAANGPRMPLAIVRATAGELPRAFKLDDAMAMTPAARLSTTRDVIVEARISKSGSATPSPGDLRGSSAPVKPGAQDVLIVINDVVR